MANEVKLDIIINTLTDEKTKAKAEKQGKDFVEAYQKVIDSANKFKNNTDYTNDSSLTKDLAKQIEGLSQIGNKAFKKQIDTWLKQINSYIKQAESQISVFDMPNTPTKPPKPPKDNKNTDIDFNGLGKGLENAEKMMAVFLEKFQKFCADLQKEANKPIKLNGLKAGITEAQKAVNDTMKSFKTSFTVSIKPVVSVTEAQTAIDKIKNSIKPIDVDVKFSNIKVPQIDSAMESIEKTAKRKIRFDGINEGVNSAKAKMQELVNDFKTKTSMLPPLAKMKVSFDGFDLSIKDKISKAIQSASKSFDDFAKKAEAMPKALDGAVNAMATSIIKLEAGINGLVTVVASAVTRITDEVKKLPKSFDGFQNTIKVTGRMLRDLGKNTGKGVKGQLSSISSDLKKFETTLNSLGSALPSKLVSALNQIASAVSRMEALVIRLNNTFKNLDVKSFDNIKVKAQEIEAVFRTLNTAGNDLGKNTGKPMYSALTGLQKKLRGLIQLLREAQKEARNLGTSFGGTYTADISALNSALAGLQSRLEAISRIQLPNIPRVPNIPSNSGGNNGGPLGNLLGGSMPNLSLPAMNGLNNVASGVTGALQNFQSRVSNAAKAMGRLPEEINNLIVKFNVIYYGLPNIANTLTAPFASGFEFQADVETSQLGLSGILTQMTTLNGEAMTFDKAMEVSEGVFERLNQQAILTAASTKDLITTFQGLAAPAFGQGFNLEQLEDFTVKGVNVAKAFRLNSTQFVQELRDLLNGGIQAASSTIATSFGITDAKLKEWRNSEEGLFAHLMDVFKGFGPAMAKFPATLTGMKDQITEFGQLASRQFTLTFENDIKYVMSIIQNFFGTIKKNADGVKYFEPNPLIKEFFDTVGQSVRQLGLLWSEFISTIGSFDSEGVFNVTPKGMELWDTFKATLGQIWGVILLINESIAAASPIWVDIAIGLQQVLQFGLQVVASALAPMVEYTKYVADNWEIVKEKIIEFATEVYNSSTVLNTIVAGVKVIAGAVVGLAQGVGYVIDNWDAMKPVIVEITTDIIAIWGALKIMNALVVGAKIFVTALEAAYLAVRTAVVLVMGAVRALAALEAMLTLIQRVGDLATAWRFVRLMIFRAYGATKALALADFIVNTIRNVNNLSSAWMAVTIILKEVIRLTKATAIWSAVSSVVSGIGKLFAANPALGLVGAGAAIGGIGAIGALINKVFDEVSGAFDSVSGMTDNFAEEAKKDMQDLMQAFNNVKPPEDKKKDTKPNIDPKAVESSIKREPDKKAQEKAEKERLKLAKKALKEMLSSLDAHLKEQLSILKDAMERTEVLYKQNQMGWQEYSTEKAENTIAQERVQLEVLNKKIEAIQNSTSFDNEDDRQNQLNPLIEKRDELKRLLEKSIRSQNEIADVVRRSALYTAKLLSENRQKAVQANNKNGNKSYTVNGGSQEEQIAIRTAQKYNIDPALLLTVMDIESNKSHYDSNGNVKVNSIGATGAMQLMPETAAYLGVNPYDLEQNIEGGAKYLREMLDMFHNDVTLAVAAYNAGPGKVQKYGGVPPFEETRNYIVKLNDRYAEHADLVNRITVAEENLADKANASYNAEGSTWYRETPSVNIEDLNEKALTAISLVSDYYNKLTGKQMVVSSGYRTWGGHVNHSKFDVVDHADDTLLENNVNGIRDAIISYAESIGLKVIDEYSNPSANATAGHLDFNAKDFDVEKFNKGIINQDLNTELGIVETELGLEAKEKAKKALEEIEEIQKEYNEIVGDIFTIPAIQLERKYDELKNRILKDNPDDKGSELAGIIDNIKNIKLNRLSLTQSKEYLDRALDIIEDNASTMMYKIGNGFIEGASNIKEMTTKYLGYMVKGGNYPFGEFDIRKILSDLEAQLKKAENLGDTNTYLEIKSKIKSIKDSLMSIIDSFQQQVKEAANWMSDMIDLSKMTSLQKEEATNNLNAKMNRDLSLSEREKAYSIITSNENKILEIKKEIAELNKDEEGYANRLAEKQQEINKLQSDPTVQEHLRNASLYMRKYETQLQSIKGIYRDVEKAAKQALEDSLIDLLDTSILECKNLEEALSKVAQAILKAVHEILVKKYITMFMNKVFPVQDIGGDIGNGAVETAFSENLKVATANVVGFAEALQTATEIVGTSGAEVNATKTTELATTEASTAAKTTEITATEANTAAKTTDATATEVGTAAKTADAAATTVDSETKAVDYAQTEVHSEAVMTDTAATKTHSTSQQASGLGIFGATGGTAGTPQTGLAGIGSSIGNGLTNILQPITTGIQSLVSGFTSFFNAGVFSNLLGSVTSLIGSSAVQLLGSITAIGAILNGDRKERLLGMIFLELQLIFFELVAILSELSAILASVMASSVIPFFASGGSVFGAGTATSDSIPAWLSNGEYVINAKAVSKYGTGFFDALNNGSYKKKRGYATGGFVSTTSTTRKTETNSMHGGDLVANENGDITNVIMYATETLMSVLTAILDKVSAFVEGNVNNTTDGNGIENVAAILMAILEKNINIESMLTVIATEINMIYSWMEAIYNMMVQIFDMMTQIRDWIMLILDMMVQIRDWIMQVFDMMTQIRDWMAQIFDMMVQIRDWMENVYDIISTIGELMVEIYNIMNSIYSASVLFYTEIVPILVNLISEILIVQTASMMLLSNIQGFLAEINSLMGGTFQAQDVDVETIKNEAEGEVKTSRQKTVDSLDSIKSLQNRFNSIFVSKSNAILAKLDSIEHTIKISNFLCGIFSLFAEGGSVHGEGTSTSDSILARLSNGEFVMKASAVRKYGTDMLERINNGTFSNMKIAVPAFATGGIVGSEGNVLADMAIANLSGSFDNHITVTNYVNGQRTVDTDLIRSIVRQTNIKDAALNAKILRRKR